MFLDEFDHIIKISIHALREEGDLLDRWEEYSLEISIHALREEGDLQDRRLQLGKAISIHALREEGDASPRSKRRRSPYFYPRPPRGGRPRTRRGDRWAWEFLSTPSARRATEGVGQKCAAALISIHALREEGDSKNRDKISIFL